MYYAMYVDYVVITYYTGINQWHYLALAITTGITEYYVM